MVLLLKDFILVIKYWLSNTGLLSIYFSNYSFNFAPYFPVFFNDFSFSTKKYVVMTPNQFQNFLKSSLSNLAEFLLTKLQKPPDKYNLISVIQYYSSFAITADFCLVGTTKKAFYKSCKILKVLKLLE